MDTRTKIVTGPEALKLAEQGALVVSGYFDPLLADHAARLHELKRGNAPMLVLIATSGNAILPAGARAELVASLSVVDHVAELAPGIRIDVHLEPEDTLRLERLIEHVHARQCVAS